jgi:protoheme IX farnesyltransferase
VLSTLALGVGIAWLIWKVNLLTAALGLASWILYVVVYTPLKTRTTFNTTVGAVAGAIPVLMGWSATGAPLSVMSFALAGVIFLWQFPHFMAIAWLYRREYADAGHQMLSSADELGLRCAVQAVVGALVLIPISLIPSLSSAGGSPLVYFVWTLCLGLTQFGLAVRFALWRDEVSARLLLLGTLLYVPAWLAMLLMVTM